MSPLKDQSCLYGATTSKPQSGWGLRRIFVTQEVQFGSSLRQILYNHKVHKLQQIHAGTSQNVPTIP